MRELEWLYEHWGTEFRFLSQHRLKICDEADRSEGRRMVRALMAGRDPFMKEEEDQVVINGSMGDYEESSDSHVKHTRIPSAPRMPFL